MSPVIRLQCPKCGSGNLRRSHQTRALDILLRIFMLQPFRCRSCHRRCYLHRGAAAAVAAASG